jgi:type III secretion protein J
MVPDKMRAASQPCLDAAQAGRRPTAHVGVDRPCPRRGRRPGSALFAAVVLAAALAAGCSTAIQHGLDEASANEVTAALERAGIAADKIRDEAVGATGFIVQVEQDDAVRALEVLRASGLPRGHRSGFAEVYAQPSLVPTATEERARYVEALSGEIQRTLESVDGVVAARVHLVLAEVDPLAANDRPRIPAQAAVLLKARPGLPPIKESDVQKLVAGSVPGLAAASVAVVILPGAAQPARDPFPYSDLGPFRVAASSRPVAIAAVAVVLSVLALLAILLLYVARRLATAQRELATLPRPPERA